MNTNQTSSRACARRVPPEGKQPWCLQSLFIRVHSYYYLAECSHAAQIFPRRPRSRPRPRLGVWARLRGRGRFGCGCAAPCKLIFVTPHLCRLPEGPMRQRCHGYQLFLTGLILAANTPAWETSAGNRSAPLTVPQVGKAGFTLLSPSDTGITFTNSLPEQRHLTNQILLNGSGVAAGDIDGDGLCDLFFCHLGGPSALYRNLGNWKFEDITVKAGVACSNLDATGAAFADLDGDGDLDLIVNSVGGGTRLFLNDGKGHFTESPLRLNPG